jgi:hypothetical protein
MDAQIAFYHSTRDGCGYGQILHLSVMNQADIPYCQWLHLGWSGQGQISHPNSISRTLDKNSN